MWALENATPYAAGRNWVRDKDGIHWWLVAIRATFVIEPGGQLTLADEQPQPVLEPEYRGEPGESSLRHDSDLLDRKLATDMLLLGSAHAPHGRPAATVPVTLRAGPLEKTLLVHGERTYREGPAGPAISAPQPFVARPIIYELAFGGRDVADPDPRKHRIDERNPVGRGYSRGGGDPEVAHAIEYPGGDPAARGPAGFGPIDRSWLPRRTLAGTFDARWSATKRPLLPDDHDPAFALCAPADQRVGLFRGGERIELLNLSPEGRLVFNVPQIGLDCVSYFGAHTREHGAQLATILVEPDERRLTLMWQSSLRVASADADYLDVTEIVERRATR